MFRVACSFRQRYAEFPQSLSEEYGAFLFHFWQISKRETELVALIRKGLRTKEIADQLKISHHTVRNIRQRMFEKYNVNNSIELLNKAV